METVQDASPWAKVALIIARLILALVFLMAFASKAMNIGMIANVIGSAGFPLPYLLAVIAAVFELALVLSLLIGTYFSEMMLLGSLYVVFLAFAFHGPSHWTDAKGLELGSFVSHFPFAAAMLLAAVHGPGQLLAMNRGVLRRHVA
jgi:putative oxidoreductase